LLIRIYPITGWHAMSIGGLDNGKKAINPLNLNI
jgi:hypothetical protein